MKTNNKKINSAILCLCELLIGILLLIKPVGFTSGIIIAIGIALALRGILRIVAYFKAPAQEAAKQRGLSEGIVCLLIGLFCALKTGWLLTVFPFVGMIYGIMLVLLGVDKLQTAVDQKRLGLDKWYMAAISSAISLVCGAIIMCNPFTTTVYLWMFTGISLIVEAAMDVVSLILYRKKA